MLTFDCHILDSNEGFPDDATAEMFLMTLVFLGVALLY